MKKILKLFISALATLSIGFSTSVLANTTIPETRPDNLIYDPNNYLNDEVEQFLVKLNNESKQRDTRPEVGVLIVDSFEDKDIKKSC